MENTELSAIKSIDHKSEQQMEASSKSSAHVAEVINGSFGGSTSGGSSHKMGSRRIFTPQFKLQVLESYRNDNDCKGNQRATARKYNIHRRQIQKWLQCESSLRSSVANINQNTVKHQFHNISIYQQQSSKASNQTAPVTGVSYGNMTSQSQPEPNLVVPTGVKTLAQTQAEFSAANLAVVVAGAMTITNAPSNGSSVSTESVTSPLHSSSISSINSNTSTTMSPLLHHHHYGMPSYMHTPASVQLSVPILAHHISHPQHIHQQNQHHQSYQYHNLPYTQTLAHSSDKQQSSFLSSLSLPDINAISAASAPTSNSNGFTAVGEAVHTDDVEKIRFGIKSGSDIVLKNNSLGQSYKPKTVYQSNEHRGVSHPKAIHSSLYQFKRDVYPLIFPLGPMDLSLRHRRDENLGTISSLTQEMENNVQRSPVNDSASIVDLTHRKRKEPFSACNDSSSLHSEILEKHLKLNDTISINKSNEAVFTNFEEEEVEIEVVTDEKLPPSKPVKLFKPYLLDEDADTDNSVTCSSRSTETRFGESCESTCPWTTNPSPSHCVDTSTCSIGAFHYSLKDSNMSASEGSNFHTENKSAFTSIPAISPTFFRCPKGSPSSSGYESSSSTYSDSSISSRAETCPYARTYSINLQMHSIYNDNLKVHASKHVERWLEQEA